VQHAGISVRDRTLSEADVHPEQIAKRVIRWITPRSAPVTRLNPAFCELSSE
jgi:hypothetical protein